jgi:hypothetical protein
MYALSQLILCKEIRDDVYCAHAEPLENRDFLVSVGESRAVSHRTHFSSYLFLSLHFQVKLSIIRLESQSINGAHRHYLSSCLPN